MEVLELPGYTEEEKLAIARDHLVAKQVENHGLTKAQLTFTDSGLRAVIRGYTREAGVRNLEREIGAICRKIARRRAEGDDDKVKVTPELVHELLGAPRFMDEEVKDRTRNPGVATGMAWTPVGGDVLFVEATRMAGSGSLTLTGQLGDVMKESARAALSWVRAHANEWQIDPDFFKNSELHVHVPSGAIPKDGPSAGVTMVTAMVSELTRRPVRGDLSMTGEITLQGKVLPVGGIKEKVLAAKRLGIKEIILPRQNDKDVKEDLSEELRKGLTIHLVSTIDEVLLLALVHENDRPRASRRASSGGGEARGREAGAPRPLNQGQSGDRLEIDDLAGLHERARLCERKRARLDLLVIILPRRRIRRGRTQVLAAVIDHFLVAESRRRIVAAQPRDLARRETDLFLALARRGLCRDLPSASGCQPAAPRSTCRSCSDTVGSG